jgi:2-desacetyl-2-hydroxyethyl bacteriochlorophyllide A dehydrogenase
MRAVQFDRPHEVNIITKSLPPLGENEVLIGVEACGICGTDVHIVEGTSRSNPPVVLGHEYCGVVEDMGRGVEDLRAGQRVAVDPNISCGACYYCHRGLVHLCSNLRALGVDIDGGMSERCVVPATQVYRVPDGMAAEIAALVEPVSCGVHGIDLAGIQVGDTVLVIGGGTMGLVMAQLARASGAARVVVVETLEQKRAIAKERGVDLVLDPATDDVPSAVRDLTGVGADVVIECVGKPETVQLSMELARRGATVEIFGVCPIGATVPLEPNMVYFKELRIVGSYINPHTFDRALALLASGSVTTEGFTMERFPLDGVREALQSTREGRSMKCILVPQS